MHKQFAIIGGGYLGLGAVARMERSDCQVTVTCTTHAKSDGLSGIGTYRRVLKLGDKQANYDFLLNMDGIVICIGPKQRGIAEYQSVFGAGLDDFVKYLRTRNATRPLHITFISSTGVYGDYRGSVVNEDSIVDRSHPINQIITRAEQKVLSLENGNTNVCVLRLGGLYGPGRDIYTWLKGSSGQQVNMDGDHALAWTSVVDAVNAIEFAFENQLSGIYNCTDDTQLTRRELGSLICDEEGLPPILWRTEPVAEERISNARVSNAKLKNAGFTELRASMLPG